MARSSRAAPILALVAGLPAALVACSLLDGLNADYNLKSGAGEGGTDGDAGTDSAAPGDATDDTNVPTDGGDGGVPTAFCASIDAGPNGFCWDFEESTAGAPNWGWSDSLAVGGSTSVVDGIGMNGSKALRAGVKNTSVTSGEAYLHQAIAGSKFTDFRHHEMSFYYAITKGTPLYTAVLGALGFGGNGGQYIGASIYASGATPGVIDISDPPGTAAGTSVPVTLNEWKKVRIILDRPGDTGAYTTTVFVGTTQVEETPPPFNAGSSTAPTQAWIGTFYSATGDGSVEAVIDNVLVQQSN